jgi:phosphoribosylformylglycinamidine synthase
VPEGRRPDFWLFSESASRALLSCDENKLDVLLERARALGVPAQRIGSTGGDRIRVPGVLDLALEQAEAAWAATLPENMDA